MLNNHRKDCFECLWCHVTKQGDETSVTCECNGTAIDIFEPNQTYCASFVDASGETEEN